MKLLKLVPENTNIHFLKWRVPFYVVSAILVIASWTLVFTKGLNYGVDFSGGQEISATFTKEKDAPISELREIVARRASRSSARRSRVRRARAAARPPGFQTNTCGWAPRMRSRSSVCNPVMSASAMTSAMTPTVTPSVEINEITEMNACFRLASR